MTHIPGAIRDQNNWQLGKRNSGFEPDFKSERPANADEKSTGH